MRTCLNAATLRQGLPLIDFIEVAGAAGYEGIELRLAAALEFIEAHGEAAFVERLQRAGVAVASAGLPAPLAGRPEEFVHGLALMPPYCELAARLGAPGGQVGLPWRPSEDYTVTREETIDRIGQVAHIAARHELAVYLEFISLHLPNRPPWSLTLGQTLDIIEAVGEPNVGPLIDSYHWHLGGTPMSDLQRVGPGLPIMLHINDAPAGAPSTLDDSMRVLPGEGVLDLPGWLRAIREATGYDGFVSLELFSEELRALEPVEAARRGKQALDRVLARMEGGAEA